MTTHPGRTGDIRSAVSGIESGPPIVLIHSLGTDMGMWADQISMLGVSRRVVAIDLPGHGGSTARPGPYSLPDLGRDVLDLLDAASIGPFELAGVSLGGLIALWIAIECGDRISALIAANTAPRIGSREFWDERMASVRREGMAGVRDLVVPRFYKSGLELRRPLVFAAAAETFDSTDPVGYLGCCAALRDADLTNRVGSIRAHTLVIGGAFDVATPPDQSRSLHAAIAGSRVAILDDAGHLANQDAPEAFNKVVGDFLAI